jgi:DNA-binding GntR family transcriptional regulator
VARRRGRHNPFDPDWDAEPVTRPERPRLVPADVDAAEMGEVLAALEGLAAEQAITVMRSQGFGPLEAALDRMKQAMTWGDSWDLTAAHLEFHGVFVELGGNRIVRSVWNGAGPLLRRHARREPNDGGPSPVDDHLELLNLARRAAVDVARYEIEQHARNHFPPVTRKPARRYDYSDFEEDDDGN